jgi:hypothetical protein
LALSGGHAVGDDRDVVEVNYSGAGAPRNDLIQTGLGAGFTGWTTLDSNTVLTNHDPRFGGGPSLSISPCFQAGELSYSGASGPGPNSGFCSNATLVADVPLRAPVSPSQRVTLSSLDNRASFPAGSPSRPEPGANFLGALIRLTVPVGEPGPAVNTEDPFGFIGAGIPSCTADLSRQTLSCTGLVSGESYTITHGSASGAKTVARVQSRGGGLFEHTALKRGDTFAVANSTRRLTTLHVARLKVHLVGNSGDVRTGRCSPSEYWGSPQFFAPPGYYGGGSYTVSSGGSTGPGEFCPLSGKADGLSGSSLGQTDELSGGQTLAEVGKVTRTQPLSGETMYGSFTARATGTDGHPEVLLSIERAHKVMRRLGNADTAKGVRVKGLAPGNYVALWTVHDVNGDTRTVSTAFTEHRLGNHKH